jgi:hypothetical protein
LKSALITEISRIKMPEKRNLPPLSLVLLHIAFQAA